MLSSLLSILSQSSRFLCFGLVSIFIILVKQNSRFALLREVLVNYNNLTDNLALFLKEKKNRENSLYNLLVVLYCWLDTCSREIPLPAESFLPESVVRR